MHYLPGQRPSGDGISNTTQQPDSAPEFTPGPWVIDELGDGTVFGVKADDGSGYVVPVGKVFDFTDDVDVDQRQAWADARLIAAAPELYAALETLLSYAEGSGWACLPDARAALAAARGE